MRAGDVAVLLIGIVAVAVTLVDVFQSVIVPRAPTTIYRISLVVWRGLWLLWPAMAERFYPHDAARREELFGTFAPFSLIAMFLTWVAVLVLGYGAVLWALRLEFSPLPRSYWDSAYYAGTSLLTIGANGTIRGFARFVSLCAAVSGYGVVSVTTAYLFALFGTFQRRESFVVAVSARAGSPPSGVGLFEIAAKTHTQSSLRALMIEAQAWIAALMESHLAYPVLAFFRSSHDEQSWIGTLGALLDASLLANTVLDHGEHGEARICFAIGRHAVRDLSTFFQLTPTTEHHPGIDRHDFDDARQRLAAAGYTLREPELAWREFTMLRAEYAGQLNAMASFFRTPQAQWVGDRGKLMQSPHPM